MFQAVSQLTESLYTEFKMGANWFEMSLKILLDTHLVQGIFHVAYS